MTRWQAVIVASLALGAGAVAAAISSAALEGIPHIADEISYAFQGRILASGRLWLDPPPLPEVFQLQHVILDSARWCSKYPPGWPLLLAAGWLAGLPWLVAPILLALSVAGVFALGRVLFDVRTGVLAASALAASPFALLMGAGFMSHIAALCASVWCLAALAEAAKRGRAPAALAAGLLGGAVFLTRPYTAVALLLPGVVWCLWRSRSLARSRVVLSGLVIGFIPFLVLFLAYNALVFGGPLKSGYAVYDPKEAFSRVEGAEVGPLALLSVRLPWYLAQLNHSLWGWPWANLLVLTPLLLPRPGRGKDALLLACAASLVLAHGLYYWYDVAYGGPRLVFEALGPLSVAAARALLTLADLCRRICAGRKRLVRILLVGCALGLLAFPLGVRLPREIARHGQWYHGQSAAPLRQAVSAGVGEDALILVTGPPWVFGSFFLQNALDPLTGRRVFVRNVPGLEERLATAIPRRETWSVRVTLDPLPGPNFYPDAFRARSVVWQRLR